MIHSTVNLPYVGGVATSRTTSSPSLNFGYVIQKYFLPSLVTWVSLWRVSLKWRQARMCLKTNSQKSILLQEGQEEGAMTWNGLSIRSFKTSQRPPELNRLLELYVAGYSDHNNQLLTDNLNCNSCLLFQSQPPTSKHFETTGCQLSTKCRE